MQVKVLGAERRRRWSYDEKVRLVEETLRAGETVCGVARRHGMAQSLLFTWRRQARQGRLALQLPFRKVSESMGNHDSKIVGADSVD